MIMTIMWTASSFSFYLLLFMTKYFEGSIYINYYLDGISGIIGTSVAAAIYPCVRMRTSYFISISFTLLNAIALLIYWENYANPDWILFFSPKPSPYEEGGEEDRQFCLGMLIPILAFNTKVGISATF